MSKRKKIAAALLCLIIGLPAGLVLLAIATNGRTGVGDELGQSAVLQAPPAVWTEARTLKAVTFNIQDLYLRSEDRPLRMRSIGAKLFTLDPDIVGFQEAFIAEDRAILLKELASGRLQYHQYYPSGNVGSGLLIVSAFPIEEVFFHQYEAANPFYMIQEGDWWAGKGVALARIALPEGGLLDFYNTHAQAGYGNPEYDIVRKEQMAELAAFVNESHCETLPGIVVGDMNCRPGEADFGTAVSGAGLTRVMIGESRIDHIFALQREHYTYEVLSTEPIEATVKLGEKTISLSDHAGYMSTIQIRPKGVPATPENGQTN